MEATLRRERLENLYRVVKAAPVARVVIFPWYGVGPCGTVACAAGWATQDPYFQRLGLHLVSDGVSDDIVRMRPCVNEGAPSSRDLAEMFGLTMDEVMALFFAADAWHREHDGTPRDIFLTKVAELIDATPKVERVEAPRVAAGLSS